jgi:serine/threonine-protein kinase
MTPERLEQVERLFHEAVRLDPDRRQAFLNEACAGDQDMQAEVESLIASDEQAEQNERAVEKVICGVVGEFVKDDQLAPVGMRIGPYELVREVGRGGMGAVYLAERVDQAYRKQVVIKLVKRGMDTDEVLRRFRHERQILADLDHPNIARLLDGGTTEDGRPYFVMEYIEGQPIHHYCDAHKLSIVERLNLFRTVCSAVHYAHQNLVVHRDLKPSNILVTADGVPKLLDFGIAKVLQSEGPTETLTATAVELRPMTPEYASPEQVRGEPVTTASDVYSLGVLLYELLTGRRPYQFKSSLPQEIERVITEEEPEKPSDSLLRGDLDTIVLMAMRKEPQRRYASVQQFSEDIRRHLVGLPVIARKDTLSYRAGKFVSRHRVGVGVTAVFVLLVIGFGASMAVQSARLARERDAATRERMKAEQVSAFLIDLFKVSDPSEAKGRTITAQEILNKGAEKITTELKGQPEVQATVMDTIGRVYENLGLYDNAAALLEAALKLRRQTFGAEHPAVAQSLNNLAEVVRKQGAHTAAESLYREALQMQLKLLGPEHPDVAESLDNLAIALEDNGDYKAAEPLFRDALQMRRKLFGEEHVEVAESLNNLGVLLWRTGDYDAAEPLLRQALAAKRNLLGEEHPDVALGLDNLAVVLHLKSDYEAAEPVYREALALFRKLLGPEHPDVATNLSNLAVLLYEKSDYAAAEQMLREALDIQRKRFGEHSAVVANSLTHLATVRRAQGDYSGAEPLYRQALELRRKALPAGHPQIARSLTGLGGLLAEKGTPRQAEPLLREALEILRKAVPKDHWWTADAESGLGSCLVALRRYDEAEPLLVESYSTLKAKRGERNKLTEQTLKRLVDLYEAWGKPEQAAESRARLEKPKP